MLYALQTNVKLLPKLKILPKTFFFYIKSTKWRYLGTEQTSGVLFVYYSKNVIVKKMPIIL